MRETLVFLILLPFVALFVINQRIQEFTFQPQDSALTDGKSQTQTLLLPGSIERSAIQAQPIATPVPSIAQPLGVFDGLLSAARSWLGVPYLWAGCSRRGVDCSCFVQNVLSAIGISAPRTTITQVAWASPVALSDARPFDLLFFDNTCTGCGPNPTHVGMYLGNGTMIHAGDPVHIESINTPYWQAHLHSVGRPRGL
jgi:cell wall-associated NlpC family hydrolase